MRFPHWIFIFMSLMFTSALAALNHEIAVGAFSSPEAAQSRLAEVRTHLEQNQTISPLLEAKRFGFDVEPVAGLYRVALTHFEDKKELSVVLQSVKQLIPDAYLVGKASAAPWSSEAAPDATPVATEAPAETKPAEGEITVVEETVQAVQEQSGPATEPVEEVVTVTETETVAPDAEAETEIISETVTPQSTEDDTSLLLYAIAGAVVLLAALLFVARRKRPSETFEAVHETPEEEAAAQAHAVHEEVPEAAAEEAEPLEPVEEAVPEVAETQMPAEAIPAEIAEEEPVAIAPDSVEEAPEPEAVVEAVPAAAEKPAGAVTRKKRDLPAEQGTVTKEQLSEFAGNRILIAEDNLINQKVITRLLEGSGMDIVIANNGQEAIDILNDDPDFKMVLMDAHMPIKDGFQATREIRENPRFDATVVVALSGDVGSDDIRKMRDAGMEEQLAKPLRIEELYAVMYQYLDLAGEQNEENAEEEELPELKGHESDTPLNAAEGLEICGGDKEMYAEILDEFIETYGSANELVKAYLRADDDAKLVALMLDIKGVAANIGADRLSEAAETLREAVLINQVESYDAMAVEFEKELHKALAAIESFKNTL
ncbi:MAG: response regulator [Campylobacterales bacterium]